MPDFAAEIASAIGFAPPDLVDYYEAGNFPKYKDSLINCLPFEKAKSYTQDMVKMPSLGLWILDDSNDSNPHAYISVGPCKGMILHIYHDDSSQIVFKNLADFIAIMHQAGREGIHIWDIKPQEIRVPLDLAIRKLLVEKPYDAEFLITIYLSITKKLERETLSLLVGGCKMSLINSMGSYLIAQGDLEPDIIELFASAPDWQARGALATYLSVKTPIAYLPLAEKLAAEKKGSQVSVPAEEAVKAMRKQLLPIQNIHLLNGDIELAAGRCRKWAFEAWCYPGGVLQDYRMDLYSLTHLPPVPRFGVISVRARADELWKCAHLEEFVGPVIDATFNSKVSAREEMERNRYNIVNVEDPRFGRFSSDPRKATFEGLLLWQSIQIKLIIQVHNYYKMNRDVLETTVRARLDNLFPVAENIPDWEIRIKTYAVENLHAKCKDKSLSPETFYKRLKLVSLGFSIQHTDVIEFTFDEGDLFRAPVTIFYNPENGRMFDNVYVW